jgi:hypothetical protein
MIFQYHIARITLSAPVYGHARCITFELFTTCSLDMLCMGMPFTTTNTSSMDVKGEPLLKCRNVGLFSILYGTGMNRNADAGTCLEPE